jgi:hypothetical protein
VASAVGRFSAFGHRRRAEASANIHGNRRSGGFVRAGEESRSISDPQEGLPLAKVVFDAHALGKSKLATTHRSICLPSLPAPSPRDRLARIVLECRNMKILTGALLVSDAVILGYDCYR